MMKKIIDPVLSKVLDLLGPNLEELFAYCGRQFSLKTILLIGLQLVTRVERIHSRGLVFR